MDRQGLLKLITLLYEGEGDDRQASEWIALIEANVPHPRVSDLIFYPKRDMTPEEMLEEALSYVPEPPVALPPLNQE
jgi:hypothetical protein